MECLSSSQILLSTVGRPKIGHNVLALGEEADFEALYCQPSTKADARQNVQLTTEPAFLPNACYL